MSFLKQNPGMSGTLRNKEGKKRQGCGKQLDFHVTEQKRTTWPRTQNHTDPTGRQRK